MDLKPDPNGGMDENVMWKNLQRVAVFCKTVKEVKYWGPEIDYRGLLCWPPPP